MLRFDLIFHLFRRSAKIQRRRMLMTVMAIAWGTIAIVLLLSFGEGLKRSFARSAAGLGTGILVVWPGTTSKPFAGLPVGRDLHLRAADVELLRQSLPELGAASAEIRTRAGQISVGRVNLNKQIVGVEPSFGDLRAHYPDPGGRFIDELDQRYKRRVIFLGNKLKDELFGDQPAVGNTVQINQIPFTVIGVMHKKQQNNMYGGPDDDHAAIPESTFEAIFGRQYLSDMVLKPKHANEMGELKTALRETLGRKYRFDPSDERALPMWDTQKTQKITNNILVGIEIFLGMIGALTLIIGGVGVANIMYAVVRHRSRDIAIQMALGAKRSFVMGPLVLEAVALTAFGGGLGIAVGVAIQQGLAYIQHNTTNQALELLGAPTFSWAVALTTVALLGLIGLAAGYFPARRAVTVQPAVVLRDE